MPKDQRVKVDLPDELKQSLTRLSVKTGNSQASLIRQAVLDLIQKYKEKGIIE
jgi:predicted DNA-binding protein